LKGRGKRGTKWAGENTLISLGEKKQYLGPITRHKAGRDFRRRKEKEPARLLKRKRETHGLYSHAKTTGIQQTHRGEKKSGAGKREAGVQFSSQSTLPNFALKKG